MTNDYNYMQRFREAGRRPEAQPHLAPISDADIMRAIVEAKRLGTPSGALAAQQLEQALQPRRPTQAMPSSHPSQARPPPQPTPTTQVANTVGGVAGGVMAAIEGARQGFNPGAIAGAVGGAVAGNPMVQGGMRAMEAADRVLGAPVRGAILGTEDAFNTGRPSAIPSRIGQAVRDPSSAQGRDFPGIRNISDDPWIGPVSKRDAVGMGAEMLADVGIVAGVVKGGIKIAVKAHTHLFDPENLASIAAYIREPREQFLARIMTPDKFLETAEEFKNRPVWNHVAQYGGSMVEANELRHLIPPQKPLSIEAVKSLDAPSAQQINTRTWWHGSRGDRMNLDNISSAETKDGNLFGRGIYFADDPVEIPWDFSGQGMGHIYTARIKVNNVINMNEEITPTSFEAFVDAAKLMAHTLPLYPANVRTSNPAEEVASLVDEYSRAAAKGTTNQDLWFFLKDYTLNWNRADMPDPNDFLYNVGVEGFIHRTYGVGGGNNPNPYSPLTRGDDFEVHAFILLKPELNSPALQSLASEAADQFVKNAAPPQRGNAFQGMLEPAPGYLGGPGDEFQKFDFQMSDRGQEIVTNLTWGDGMTTMLDQADELVSKLTTADSYSLADRRYLMEIFENQYVIKHLIDGTPAGQIQELLYSELQWGITLYDWILTVGLRKTLYLSLVEEPNLLIKRIDKALRANPYKSGYQSQELQKWRDQIVRELEKFLPEDEVITSIIEELGMQALDDLK